MPGQFSNRVVILAILGLLGVLSLWLPTALIVPVVKFDGAARHDPDYYVRNFTLRAMDARGQPRYLLSGASLNHYPDDDSTHLEQPRLTQYQPDQVVLYTTADRGRLSADGKELLMRGNVKVIRSGAAESGDGGGEVRTQEMSVLLE